MSSDKDPEPEQVGQRHALEPKRQGDVSKNPVEFARPGTNTESKSGRVAWALCGADANASKFAFGSIFVLLLLVRIYYFDGFWVPDSDFFSFQQTAQALIRFEPPPSLQRLPLFSLAMAVISLAIPGRDAMLVAGKLINLACFGGALILLYRIGSRLSGPHVALASVLLFGLHPQTVDLSIQPVSSMMSVALVLLALDLGMRQRRTAYLAAGLAALVRYEGAFMIAALAIHDLLIDGRFIRTIVQAGAASLGLLAWLALNYAAAGHLNPYFSYESEAAAGAIYLRTTFDTLASFSSGLLALPPKPLAALLLLLFGLGVSRWIRRSPPDAALIGFFLAACTALNLIFFGASPRHVFITLWVFVLAISDGAAHVVELAGRRIPGLAGALDDGGDYPGGSRVAALALGAAGGILILAQGDALAVKAFWMLSFWTVSVYVLIATRPVRAPRVVALAVVVGLIWLLAGGNAAAIAARMNGTLYAKASLRLAGEWYESHGLDGERLVVSEPWVVEHYVSPAKRGGLIYLGSFHAATVEEFRRELQDRGVQYVVWDSDHGKLNPDYFYYRKNRIALIKDLSRGENTAHFKLAATVRAGWSYAHIYRFAP